MKTESSVAKNIRRSGTASNQVINRTENASAFGRKEKSKLRWWPNLRVAAGYHEPLELEKIMNKWKITFFIVLVILIASNIFWFMSILDMGITYTYQQVTVDDQKKSIDTLGRLIVKNTQKMNQKDILHLLRKSSPDAFIVEEDNIISVEGLKFEFENGTLKKVQ